MRTSPRDPCRDSTKQSIEPPKILGDFKKGTIPKRENCNPLQKQINSGFDRKHMLLRKTSFSNRTVLFCLNGVVGVLRNRHSKKRFI